MKNALGDAQYGLDRLVHRATNRMYSHRMEKARPHFVLVDAMSFVRNMRLLGHPQSDEGCLVEPPSSEPVPLTHKNLAMQQG